MARSERCIVFLLVAVMLTGCFRQADSTESDAATIAPPATSSSPLQPTLNFEPSDTPMMLITVPPSETPDPLTIRPTETEAATSTPDQIFITPESPFSTLVVGTATPTPGAAASATPGGLITPTDFLNASVEGSNSACEYQVRSGDSLFRIAINNDTTVEAIKTLNEMTSDNIFPGDILIIPGCGETTDSGGGDAPTGTTDAVPTALPDGWQIHTVRSGEVLGTIAERYGVRQSRIIEVNQLSNPNSLSVGQELIIPTP